MLHTDTFTILFHQADEDWIPIAIIPLPTKTNIRDRIVSLFLEWEYDENEETIKQIDKIVDDLYNDEYYEDDVDKFKIEQVPFYE
jgi:hypothetical protein